MQKVEVEAKPSAGTPAEDLLARLREEVSALTKLNTSTGHELVVTKQKLNDTKRRLADKEKASGSQIAGLTKQLVEAEEEIVRMRATLNTEIHRPWFKKLLNDILKLKKQF